MKDRKKKVEWSKVITGIVILFFAGYGIWSGIRYYQLCVMAIEKDSMMPDATLAVTCVTTILAALMSYCLYQWGLKNSRNKYGVDSEGEPFVLPGPYSEEEEQAFYTGFPTQTIPDEGDGVECI